MYAERIADQTAAHYDALRQRRIPLLPALVMTWAFHQHLVRTVLLDDQFDDVVAKILAPVSKEV